MIVYILMILTTSYFIISMNRKNISICKHQFNTIDSCTMVGKIEASLKYFPLAC